jgi:hypothetical protein
MDHLHHAVPGCQDFLRLVAERGGNLGATVSRLLRYLDWFGPVPLDAALREATRHDTPSLGAVRHLLDQQRHAQGQPPPLSAAISNDPRVRNQRVHVPNLATYDQLRKRPDHDDPTSPNT